MNTANIVQTGDATFDQGWVKGGKRAPYYSFTKPEPTAGWSDELAEYLEESSRSHFIDVYNRQLALDGIHDRLSRKGAAYLDMGCSSGYMLEDVLKRYPQANPVGADYFGAGLVQCHQRIPQVPLFQIDLKACPFQTESFDAISCLNVLEHIDDDVAALKQLHRILKQDGRIAITVPAGPALFDLYDEIHYHHRRYTLRQIRNAVQAAGFKIEASNYFGVFIYPGFYAVKRWNQFRFAKLSFAEKEKLAFAQIESTERSRLMERVCRVEQAIGRKLPFPFGIRAYLHCRK